MFSANVIIVWITKKKKYWRFSKWQLSERKSTKFRKKWPVFVNNKKIFSVTLIHAIKRYLFLYVSNLMKIVLLVTKILRTPVEKYNFEKNDFKVLLIKYFLSYI